VNQEDYSQRIMEGGSWEGSSVQEKDELVNRLALKGRSERSEEDEELPLTDDERESGGRSMQLVS